VHKLEEILNSPEVQEAYEDWRRMFNEQEAIFTKWLSDKVSPPTDRVEIAGEQVAPSQKGKLMQTAITTDADGAVISTLDTVPTATISFSRTVTFPDTFGAKEEASIFLQVPLVDGVSAEAITKQVEDGFATAKAAVYTQLGLTVEVQANGVVTSPAQVGAPKAAKASGGGKPRSGGAPRGGGNSNFKQFTDEEKDDGWAQLAGATVEDKGSYLSITTQQGETVYDNRTSKKSANGPDFKFKDSELALWLKDAPSWFTEPGGGIEL